MKCKPFSAGPWSRGSLLLGRGWPTPLTLHPCAAGAHSIPGDFSHLPRVQNESPAEPGVLPGPAYPGGWSKATEATQKKKGGLILPSLQRWLSPPHADASAAGRAFNKLWFQHQVCICLPSPVPPVPSTRALLCTSAGAASNTPPEAAAFPCLHSLLVFCYYYLAYK